MPLGSFFGDLGAGIGRGVLALGTGGISEYNRSNNQALGQALANAKTPAEAISNLANIGTPSSIQLATEIAKNQPAYNPILPAQAAQIQASVYGANPIMNNPPDLSGAMGGGQPQQQNPMGGAQAQPQTQGGIDPRQLSGQPFLDYLSQKSPGFAAEVKAIAEGRQAPPTPGSRGALSMMLNQAVAQYDPGFDFANAAQNFKNRQATTTEFTKGNAATNIRSIGTASNHLATLVQQIAGTANHEIPAINAVQNWAAKQSGASGITKFNQTADALASELGAVYKGAGHNSDTEIANMRQSLDANASPEQKFGALENGMNLMMGRASELAQQYNSGINAQPGDPNYKTPEDFLSPEAKDNIAKARQAIYDFKTKGTIPTNLGKKEAPKTQQAGNQSAAQPKLTGLTELPQGYTNLGNGIVQGPDGKKYRIKR